MDEAIITQCDPYRSSDGSHLNTKLNRTKGEQMVAIRGANTVEANTREAILEATEAMVREVIDQNGLKDEDMVSIFFSMTKDLDAVYPAVAARKMGITNASLLCVQELYIEGSLPLCVRLLMHVDSDLTQKDVRHVYMGGAVNLRPDLMMKELEEN